MPKVIITRKFPALSTPKVDVASLGTPKDKKKIITLIVLLVLLVILTWAIKTEAKDLFCPSNGCDSKLCGDGKGKFYQAGKLSKEDTIETSLDKIVYLSKIEHRTVKWRRSLILALLVMGIAYGVQGSFPSVKNFIFTMMISFVTIYGCFSYYQYHYYDFALNMLEDNVKHIKSLKKKTKKISL